MNELNDLEFRILDEAYFVSSYQTILQNVGSGEEIFQPALMALLQRGFISQMKYNAAMNDFERLDQPESNTLKESSFVATRQGLLIHNSSN